ncbi:hypothetical protein [Brevundimonas naejangsanensis]|uniref:hypothetical protein n=1 Tax=Brevundimonas naejangsanensis TaxID=588932 RepID=UPI003D0709A8
MTKKLLLAAAALGALAFAGAGQAADITAGRISGVTLFPAADLVPYAVANEADLAAAGIASVASTTNITIGMDSPVNLAADAVAPFAVTFTLTGPAEFVGTLTKDNLVGANGAIASTGLVVMAADKKSVTFHVEYKGAPADVGPPVVAGGSNINALTLQGVGLKVTGKQSVSIAAKATVTIAGHTQTVTEVAATKIVEFKDALVGSEATSYSAMAMLPDFKTFKVAGSGGVPGTATASTVVSRAIGLTVNEGIRQDLSGGAELEVDDILSGAEATVTGPQVKALGVTLAGKTADPATLTDTVGVYTLTAADLEATTNAGSLILSNTGAVAVEQGSYKVDLVPEFATDFSGSAEQTLTLVTIGLDGTNFYAPWFALGNAGANSTLRLANNGSTAIGPVVISLKASNGSAATGTYTIPSIDVGKFVSVTGSALKTAFGTDAANGDLMITVQSQANGLSAKVRTTQSTGQIYENSLGANSDVLTASPQA